MIKFPLPCLAAAVLAAGATAGAASAAPTISSSPSGAYYVGTTGNDVNAITPSFSPPAYKLTGIATPGANCATSGSDILCSFFSGAYAEMRGDAGDDELYDGWYTGNTAAYGDAGSDHLYSNGNTANAYGGDGNDVITTASNGGGTNYGENGNDILIARSTSLSLDGGSGADFLILNPSNAPYGAGGAGADTIVGQKSGGSYSGGTEDDIIAFGGSVTYPGGPGATVHGDAGNDRLYGSPGRADSVYGDAGDDLIDTYGDGYADTVDCGADTDTAYVDAIDATSNCETVVVGSAAPGDPQVTAALSAATTDLATAWNAITPLP